MIPREMLKKIRQIEIRTNRLVSESADGARLWEPQHARLACRQNYFGRVPSGEAAAGRRPALRSLQPSDFAATGRNRLSSRISICALSSS